MVFPNPFFIPVMRKLVEKEMKQLGQETMTDCGMKSAIVADSGAVFHDTEGGRKAAKNHCKRFGCKSIIVKQSKKVENGSKQRNDK